MRTFQALTCSAAIVLALGVAACGSDDDSGDAGSGDSSITKSEFVAQANEICAKSNAKIDSASEAAFADGQPSSEETQAFLNDTLFPAVQDQLDAIGELPVPEGEEDSIDAILTAASDGLEQAEANPEKMEDQSFQPFAEANKLAVAYGMKECGS